jgi:Fe-S-cluster containining protein
MKHHGIQHYHKSFRGNTYDACFRCGGKCEKYKISSLMPGEKEFMAETLSLELNELENKYLSLINTPYGKIDVLKMKNNCNFLDEEFRCTAIPAKPVLCDTYPIVFSISKGSVQFIIDRHDCPMVHWPEYAQAVEEFRTRGIAALRKIRVPLSWWKQVALFDEFDFDYVRIERELTRHAGYEEFCLEELLAYACNGYEEKARRRGMKLLELRFTLLLRKSIRKLSFGSSALSLRQKRLASAYKTLLKDHLHSSIVRLKEVGENDPGFFTGDASAYLETVREVFRISAGVQKSLKSFTSRIREVDACDRIKQDKALPKSEFISGIHEKFCTGIPAGPAAAHCYQVNNAASRDFWEAMYLLASNFWPNEIDSPLSSYSLMRQEWLKKGTLFSGKGDDGRKMWSKWIIVIARDDDGRLLGAADGALIVHPNMTVFYASHIAVVRNLRNRGLGAVLSAVILQAAENNIGMGRDLLGISSGEVPGNYPLLNCEVSEVEFPDLSVAGEASLKRLTFHGRLNRQVLWPFRYAQPDTDYRHRAFEPGRWNSVPMFFSYRSFNPDLQQVSSAREAAGILYDYFAVWAPGGVEWDLRNIKKGLKSDGRPYLIPFPSRREEAADFLRTTGTLADNLRRYYPHHKFTNDLLHY